jgi:hypothetical protein
MEKREYAKEAVQQVLDLQGSGRRGSSAAAPKGQVTRGQSRNQLEPKSFLGKLSNRNGRQQIKDHQNNVDDQGILRFASPHCSIMGSPFRQPTVQLSFTHFFPRRASLCLDLFQYQVC